MFKLRFQRLLLAAFSVVAAVALFNDYPSGDGEIRDPKPTNSSDVVDL